MNKIQSKLINESNDNRAPIYYRLNQLPNITGLGERMLKYRMSKLKVKYANVPVLLNKVGRSWNIHSSLVEQFMPVRMHKKASTSNYRWETLCSWNTVNSYDIPYHIELIRQVNEKISPARIKYAIEQDGRGIYHTHFVTDAKRQVTFTAVQEVLNLYLDKAEFKTDINKINNRFSITQYISKGSLANGIL